MKFKIDRLKAYLGFVPYRKKSRLQIGTWPIEVGDRIVASLRRHNYKVRFWYRNPIFRGIHQGVYYDLPREDAYDMTIYVYGRRR